MGVLRADESHGVEGKEAGKTRAQRGGGKHEKGAKARTKTFHLEAGYGFVFRLELSGAFRCCSMPTRRESTALA
ncbi:MAG: hypothetical protein RL095_847 [Verrucomicrobiota bacterium]